jgi:hypothetical protein
VAGGGEHGTEKTPVAARVLNADDNAVRTMLREPAAQARDTGAAVGDRERGDGRTSLVDERGGMGPLVDVYPNDHAPSLPVEDSIGSGSVRDATVLVDSPTLL